MDYRHSLGLTKPTTTYGFEDTALVEIMYYRLVGGMRFPLATYLNFDNEWECENRVIRKATDKELDLWAAMYLMEKHLVGQPKMFVKRHG